MCVTRLCGGVVLVLLLCPALLRGQAADEQPAAGDNAHVDLYGDPLPPVAVTRLGTVRYRQFWLSSDRQISFTGDSKQLLTMRSDQIVWLDVVTGRTDRAISLGQTGTKTRRLLALTHDQKFAVTCATESDRETQNDLTRIYVTDLETGAHQLLTSWPTQEQGYPSGAVISADDRILALDTLRGVGFWDLITGELLNDVDVPGSDHRSLSLSLDGETLVAATFRAASPSIVEWRTGELDLSIQQKRRQAQVAALSPDDKFLVTAGEESVRIWDFETRTLLRQLRQDREGTVHSRTRLAFTPDGTRVAVPIAGMGMQAGPGGRNGIELWDVAEGALVHTFPMYNPQVAAISPDGRWLAGAGNGYFVRIWDLESHEPVGRAFVGHMRPPRLFQFTADGSKVVTGTVTGEVIVWDADTGQPLHRWAHDGRWLRNIATSPDNRLVASLGRGNTLKMWDLETEALVDTFSIDVPDGPTGQGALRFTGDGEYLVCWCDAGERVRVFSTKTGETLRDYPTAEPKADDENDPLEELHSPEARLSPDGYYLAVRKRGTTSVWEVASQERLTVLPLDPWVGAQVTPESEQIVFLFNVPGREDPEAKDMLLQTFHLRTGRLIHTHRLNDVGASWFAISPDGKSVAVGHRDPYRLGVYEIETGRLLASVPLPSGAWEVRFSPDGDCLATAHSDGNLVIWDWRNFRIKQPAR